MNPIPEEASTESDKKYQTSWRNQLASPSSSSTTSNRVEEDDNDNSSQGSSYESEWEKEISQRGEVFHVVPLSEAEARAESGTNGTKQTDQKNGKLSRMVRRRESKRDRFIPPKNNLPTSPRSNGYSNQESSDNDSSTYYGQLKTFESVFEGTNPIEMHEVTLKIKSKKHVEMGQSLIEQMMGVIPVRHGVEEPQHLNSVVVAGYLTEGPAIKISDKLRIGDIIRLVDGQQVNLATIEQLLSTYTSSTKVKLTIQRPSKIFQETSSSHDDSSSDQFKTPPQLAKLITGEGPSALEVQSLLRKLPYMILYLTRHGITESSPEMSDVLYQYPSMSSGHHSAKLLKSRGLFVTLCQAIPEVTGSSPNLSSVTVDGKLVHVSVSEENEDTFIMAISATKCPSIQVSKLHKEIVRVLRLRYQSLSRAFNSYHSDLNDFFSVVMLDELLNISSLDQNVKPLLDVSTILSRNPNKFELLMPTMQWLNLPDEVRFQVDDAITQFESADFQDYSEGFYDLPREFNILGSCLFHKGFLLASHLTNDDLMDVYLWCKFKKLLNLTEKFPVHEIVSWHEVFLTSQRPESHPTPGQFEYHKENGRNFLLVVGLGYQILGCVLQTGGCATKPSGIVKPDPFYVDQAMNTLDHLDEMGIPVVCDRWLTLPSNPDIVNVDHLYEGAVQGNNKKLDKTALGEASQGTKQLPDKGIILRRTKTVEYSSASSQTESETGSLNINASKSDNSELSEELQTAFREESKDVNTSRSEDGEESTSVWELHKSGQRTRMNYSSELKRGQNVAENEEFVTYHVSQLTLSPENTLFHYIHLDIGEGIFLAPLKTTANSTRLHSELLENFRGACLTLHNTFQCSLTSRNLMKQAKASSAWLNKSLLAVKEQGILFQWSPKHQENQNKSLPLLSYWVCGRLFVSQSGSRECYVCYHDSAPQNVIELAFRLAFGTHI